MQVVSQVDQQFGGDAMGAIRWSENQEISAAGWFTSETQLQRPSDLPLPQQFISPHVSGMQESLHFIYRQLGCTSTDSAAFAKLESLASTVHERPAAKPIVESPDFKPFVDPNASPPESLSLIHI